MIFLVTLFDFKFMSERFLVLLNNDLVLGTQTHYLSEPKGSLVYKNTSSNGFG
jgi:hypothetical protein